MKKKVLTNQQLQSVFEQAAVGMVIVDAAQSRFVKVNRRFCEIVGYSAEELLQGSIHDITHPDDLHMDLDHVKRISAGITRESSWEKRYRKKDGTVVWARVFVTPLDPSEARPTLRLGVIEDITERKRAKDTYRNIFLNSQIGLYRTDMRTGLILDANDAVARFIGYQDRASLLAEPFDIAERYADPDDREKMFSLLQADGEFQNYEARFRKNDGSIRWMRFSAKLVKEKGWIEGVSEDITDRKQAEEALRESELKYRSLVDQSLLGILIVQDGRVMYANDMITEKGGYSADELMALLPIQVMELIHPNDRTVVWNRMLNRSIGKKEPERNECRFFAKDGSIYWVDVHANVIEYLGKTAIQMFIVDISDRKKAEEEIHKSEERYEALLNAFPDEILFTDLEGRIQKFSPSGLKLFGYEQEALSNRTVLDFLVPEDRDRAAHNIALMHQGIFSGAGEYRGIRADGSLVDIECNGNFIRGSDGQPTGMVFIVRDITKRKQMEEELRQYRENLENLVEERTAELGRTVEKLQFNNVILSTQQEASIDGILVVDEAANIVLYNHRFVEMWGLQAKLVEDRVDEPVLKFVTAKTADPRSFVRQVQYLYEHRQETSQDEILLADGRVFDRYSAPMLGSGGRYYGRVWYFRDITERKRVEEALISSESKYRNIFENAFEGIYQSTPEGRFITVNAAFARMAGYDSPEDLIESIEDIGTQLYVHSEDHKKILEILATRGIDDGFEVDFFKKDGSTFWVVIKSRTVRDDQGEIIYYEGNVENITQRKQAEEKLLQTLDSLRKAFGVTIQVMVSAVEVRDPYTAGHQLRSADLARAIATEMGLPLVRIDGIRMAGLIHDIGKLSIPAEILSKTTKLTEIEFRLIKEHSIRGYEILKNVESSWPLAEMVYQHHERMDGSGYPRGLKGEEILMEARIMAVADVVEAMASHRPYRPGLGINAAFEEIEKNKETLYDADVVNACLRLFREKGFKLGEA
jgi:PAS domain S-box-containing protein